MEEKSYYLLNRERILANYQLKKDERKQYYENNKHKILPRQRQYFREYYDENKYELNYRRYVSKRNARSYTKRINPGILQTPIPLPKGNLVKFGF